MNVEEFQQLLFKEGVDIERFKVEIEASDGRKPIYCYAAKGPILLEDKQGSLVAVIMDFKDEGYPLTPVVHNTHVFPGGRWKLPDISPEDTFKRERGEEYFINQEVLNGTVTIIGDFYSQFPCPKHGVYADLTSIFVNRIAIDALRDALEVPGNDVGTLVNAINARTQESRQDVLLMDKLMKEPVKCGFMDGGKFVRILGQIYGIVPKVEDTNGGLLIELPTKPTEPYKNRREIFARYLHQNKLTT